VLADPAVSSRRLRLVFLGLAGLLLLPSLGVSGQYREDVYSRCSRLPAVPLLLRWVFCSGGSSRCYATMRPDPGTSPLG
jgi:hypothetical protein